SAMRRELEPLLVVGWSMETRVSATEPNVMPSDGSWVAVGVSSIVAIAVAVGAVVGSGVELGAAVAIEVGVGSVAVAVGAIGGLGVGLGEAVAVGAVAAVGVTVPVAALSITSCGRWTMTP